MNAGSAAPRLAHVLVRSYPRAWRDRYAGELLDLLADRPVTAPVLIDLARGGLDAWLHLSDLVKGSTHMPTRLRTVSITAFAAWMLFCFAAAGVSKSTEELVFADVAHAHPLIAAARLVAGIAFGVSLAAVVVGGLPLAALVHRGDPGPGALRVATWAASGAAAAMTLGLLAGSPGDLTGALTGATV